MNYVICKISGELVYQYTRQRPYTVHVGDMYGVRAHYWSAHATFIGDAVILAVLSDQ